METASGGRCSRRKTKKMDLQEFYTGKAFDAYEYFGAHPEAGGYVFRTYAPRARGVTVVGDFTDWKEVPMTQQYQSGIWSMQSEHAQPGHLYKYCIYGANGRQEHCDPYGFGMELRPGACSVVRDLGEYRFTDEKWMAGRSRRYHEPLNIYELHLGSWKKTAAHQNRSSENAKKDEEPGQEFCTYAGIADELISYLQEHHYNYVEFMPLSEHPFDGSWGYQNTGFFAPTARYGEAGQLMELIDRLHRAGIGAIMDFVPVHFAVDAYGLKEYDGTALYEYPNKDVGESEWGSCNFNHSRGEVASFLQSAANYWLEEYHFDGLRMDAVSRLIYWQGDEKRGENGSAVNFLKIMNQGLHARHPSAILIAEDSTAYPGVTREVNAGGLGFDYKWDLGWMHDTLKYLKCHPYDRKNLRGNIMFSMMYAYNERFILPFSHDEVVHGKKTIIDKLYGTYEEKFAQAKVLYLYMMTHPGKKLNFMGNEMAMFREWDERREPDWDLLQYPAHADFHDFMIRLNALYLENQALWEADDAAEGFSWVDLGCEDPGVFGYMRRPAGADQKKGLLVILNFSDEDAEISLRLSGSIETLMNTGLIWNALNDIEECETWKGVLPAFSGWIGKCPGNKLP